MSVPSITIEADHPDALVILRFMISRARYRNDQVEYDNLRGELLPEFMAYVDGHGGGVDDETDHSPVEVDGGHVLGL